MQREREISSRLLQNDFAHISNQNLPADLQNPRETAMLGEYFRSKAQEMIMLDCPDLDGALNCIRTFRESLDGRMLTPVERFETYRNRLMEGKIMRFKGEFVKSEEILDALFLEDIPDSLTVTVSEQLVASICEQGRLDQAEKVARVAINNYQNLLPNGAHRERLREYRSLRIALVEVFTCQVIQSKISGGNSIHNDKIMELSNLQQELRRPEDSRKSGIIWASNADDLRLSISEALLIQLTQPSKQNTWENAWGCAEKCEGKVTAFIPAIIGYCDCIVQKSLGKDSDAKSVFEKAEEAWSEVGRQPEYWWIGLGTFLIDWLANVLPESGLAKWTGSRRPPLGT